ncbi:hypothetical protein LPB140_05215 [Sphingorhabdus lutea]|uniref:Putative DNA-binding domain-containing protein n=1 Tax=Sphingorhabdus lutea TaxID=1913578 RepID=A0A1L3JAY6_9SPHN|nr:putative DNA-binding domain-containing protein [Sphingorhabdus lutea]APG62305.1 hypothetical protein LPB140_05215 [Sphingorhabdus lutea]
MDNPPNFKYILDNIVNSINLGPNSIDERLYKGPIDRVFLGLMAHANTINHARLVALEETFPMTRTAMGEDNFNQISRKYIELPHIRICHNGDIGHGFADYLQEEGQDIAIIDLAKIEWAWLKSYHAMADDILTLEQLGRFDEAGLLSAMLRTTYSFFQIPLNAPLHGDLHEILGDMSASDVAAIAVHRPHEQLLFIPLNHVQYQLINMIDKGTKIENILSHIIQEMGFNDPLPILIDIIQMQILSIEP